VQATALRAVAPTPNPVDSRTRAHGFSLAVLRVDTVVPVP